MTDISPLQKARLQFQPLLPLVLRSLRSLTPEDFSPKQELSKELEALFPYTGSQAKLVFSEGAETSFSAMRVGVVLSGGQAAGGHNVIAGLYDALKALHPESKLFGFLKGPSGIVDHDVLEITEDYLAAYRNQGGFDIIGSGRTKIESEEQFQKSLNTVKSLDLNGLLVIGGDDSNTNAALLGEYFQAHGAKTVVVGAPKTIDGDLRNEDIEMSFGCDTACKVYSEMISNIARDALSAKKYYYFLKLMGRSASHIALECALQTHANLTFIGEEVAAQKRSLRDICGEICDMVLRRSEEGKHYGVILVPEGLIEFIPECRKLIDELNDLLAPSHSHQAHMESIHSKEEKIDYVVKFLSNESADCFSTLPTDIQFQLLLDRDPHGNVQVSNIETERLLMQMASIELEKRKKAGNYKGKFSAQPNFFGYEGRSGMPSNFDAQYCYGLGHVAALLIAHKRNAYMACIKNLTEKVENWQPMGIPICGMMHLEKRHGKVKPVIEKALVNLEGAAFQHFASQRELWKYEDQYRHPGPIQFFGDREITDQVMLTMTLEHENAGVSLTSAGT
ncbi:MAG: diphosphate--fructose-6-phosphate 1-phosphotransferase [Waddliaceae bacterium]|nr:diphosphate--fructose-6-phosphate 1-phosphotransferase [Waddliaceae bacterium]